MRKGLFQYTVGKDIFIDVFEIDETKHLDLVCGDLALE